MALISLDDAIVAKYLAHAQATRLPIAKLLERQLDRFSDTPITQRLVVLTGDHLQQIETALGGGSLTDSADLLRRVHRWAGITIGDIRLDFSPAQLMEIQVRAAKQGKTPEAIAQDIVAQLQEQFFFGPVVVR